MCVHHDTNKPTPSLPSCAIADERRPPTMDESRRRLLRLNPLGGVCVSRTLSDGDVDASVTGNEVQDCRGGWFEFAPMTMVPTWPTPTE